MPMTMPPEGGIPSPLAQAPANAGPMAMPQGNQGNISAALVKVRASMKMLEESLPLIPMTNDLHTDILNALKQFAKHMKEDAENSQLEAASLQAAAQNVVRQAPVAQMARIFSANQGSGQPPAQPAAA